MSAMKQLHSLHGFPGGVGVKFVVRHCETDAYGKKLSLA